MASSPRIEELQKKFDENPRRYFAPLANEYRKAGDIDQAIFICQEYLPQQPGHMSGHIVFGQALFEARRFDEAKTVFETALSLDPENLIALRHLGDIAREQGDPAAARSWYLRVLDADPRNEEIASVLASLPEAPVEAGGAGDAATEAASTGATPEASAAGGSAPEPPVDLPLETEPTESPLADFASLVTEVRDEAATRAPQAPAAELTVPHASADSDVIDLDTLDLSFGGAAPAAPAPPSGGAPAEPPAASAASQGDIAAPAAPAAPAAQAPAAAPQSPPPAPDLALELDSAVPGTVPGGTSAADAPPVSALEGLESMYHEPPANPAAFAPLDGLDVVEGSFPGAAPTPPAAAAPPALATPEPVPVDTPPPPATATSGAAPAQPLPNLDDLDALFAAESAATAAAASPEAAPAPAAPPAPPEPAAMAPAASSEPVPRTASPSAREVPPVLGRGMRVEDLPPLPSSPMKTPAWGMPDLEVPGWEVKAPPPPPTPPAAIPVARVSDAESIQAELVEETQSASTSGAASAAPAAPTAPMAPVASQPEPPAASKPDVPSAASVAAGASAPAPFVTETMAELYVRQGHREAAIGVYRQLISERPGDEGLRLRLAELESLNAAAAATGAASSPETTIRAFLAAVAERRPRSGAASSDAPGGSSGSGGAERSADGQHDVTATPVEERTAAPLDGLPVIEQSWSSEPPPRSSGSGPVASAPMLDSVGQTEPSARASAPDLGTVGGSIDMLFSGPKVATRDDRVASTLADAFERPRALEATRGDSPADMAGRPARQAATELSLDVVFREPTPAASHEAAATFSFDQFFSDGASDRGNAPSTPEQASPAQGPSGTDDIEQFNAWLEGLKKS